MAKFTYALIDDDGEIIRKFNWSKKEADWYRANEYGDRLIKLEIKEEPKLTQKEEFEQFTLKFGEPPF